MQTTCAHTAVAQWNIFSGNKEEQLEQRGLLGKYKKSPVGGHLAGCIKDRCLVALFQSNYSEKTGSGSFMHWESFKVIRLSYNQLN